MPPIITAKHLTRVYQMGPVQVPALSNATFSVDSGEMVAILGKSGSGKSTLLNLLAGLDTPTSGSIVMDGRDLALMTGRQLAQHRRDTIGIIFQSFNLVQWMTARDNVALSLQYNGMSKGDARQRAELALQSVGLQGRTTHRPSQMSGGEQQRVAIARAMANQPKILLADEPTGNLDSNTSTEIMRLIQQKNQEMGLTVLVVTHDEDVAREYCRRQIRFADGEVVKDMIMTDEAATAQGGAS